MNEASPVPDNATYCLTSQYRCEHLFVFRSSTGKPDKCRRFNGIVDRDDRQRPERIIACLARWPLEVSAK